MEGNGRDKEETQFVLMVEENIMISFLISPFPMVSFPCSSCSKVFPPKKKLNNHI